MPVATIEQQVVQYVSDAHPIRAFLARPFDAPQAYRGAPMGGVTLVPPRYESRAVAPGSAAVAQAPALLLLHEWWGLNDHTRDVAQRFTREGYVVLAPDLYSRQGNAATQDPAGAAQLMEGLSSQRALRDLNAGLRFLKAQPFVDPLALGVVGFSMGGTLGLTMAAHNSDVKAAVIFYGKVPPPDSFRYLLCPILFHHGGKDGWVTSREVDLLRQGLEQHGKPARIATYPEADHGFFNDARPEAYRRADAELAWQRTLRFLGDHLE